MQQANHARISYSSPSDEVIIRGMAALGGLLTRHMRRNTGVAAQQTPV